MPHIHGGLWNHNIGHIVRTVEPTEHDWPRLLVESGYQMRWVGNWQVHPEKDPTAFGYQSYQRVPKRMSDAPDREIEQRYTIENPGLSIKVGCVDTKPFEETHTHQLAELGIEAITEMSAGSRPWHLRLDFHEPHLPCIPAEPFANMYRPEEIPPWGNADDPLEGKPAMQRRQLENWGIEGWSRREWAIYLAGYFGIISQLDDAIGRVIAALERSGRRENTMVICTTDHGDAAGSHRMMDKHYVMYEEEVHVPLIVSWPGTVTPGSRCTDFISHFLDIGPTLLDIAGIGIPDRYQGISFLPQLSGRPHRNTRDRIFSTYHGQQFGLYTQRMIRDRRFKLVWNPTDTDELYDLESDPWELHNLACDPTCLKTVSRLKSELWHTMTGLGDSMLDNPWMRRQLTGR